MVLGPARKLRFGGPGRPRRELPQVDVWGFGRLRRPPKNHSRRRGASPPPFGMVFGAAGATQTPKTTRHPVPELLRRTYIKGIPRVFGAKWFFGGLGCQGQQTTHFCENRGYLALPPVVARPTHHSFPEKVWCFDLGTSGLQKNTSPTNHYGIPLNSPTKGPKHNPAKFEGLKRDPDPRCRPLVSGNVAFDPKPH
jgi:hypothetical protein